MCCKHQVFRVFCDIDTKIATTWAILDYSVSSILGHAHAHAMPKLVKSA